MATNVIMPALEMAQETGKILRWLKPEGAPVTKGEPIMEIETDKVTVEIEAPATGTLANVTAREGDVIPVGQTIALIINPKDFGNSSGLNASPVARKIAEEHGIDLARIKPQGGRIEKTDVLAYVATLSTPVLRTPASPSPHELDQERKKGDEGMRVRSSPKARRLAQERGIDLVSLRGTGPAGAIIAADIPIAQASNLQSPISNFQSPISTVWRVMAERMTTAWTAAPHFYLVRDVDASRLIAWRTSVQKRTTTKITFTDLLVKTIASTLHDHPRVNASWLDHTILLNDAISIGIATAIDDGLIVPVIHSADRLSIGEIATQRADLVARAQAGKLRPTDIAGGTFTLSNLGMYGVDAFNAIINSPQAAILAVGRIAERVVAVNGQPAVRPMLTLTLSCDHRAVDGARAAQFLDALANLIEEPLGLLA